MVKKFSFLDYLCEIWTVAVARVVDVSVAFLMFRADMELGYRTDHNTGNVLADFDFAAAKALWDALTTPEQLGVDKEWTEFITGCYSRVCMIYPDAEKLQELVGAWRAEYVAD